MHCQAIILAPMEDLTEETQSLIQESGASMKIRCHACTGHIDPDDMVLLWEEPHVVVSTPDRVLEMIRCGVLMIGSMRMFVMDEASEIIARGHEDLMYLILQQLPTTTQAIALSATIPKGVMEMVSSLTSEPARIVLQDEWIMASVKHFPHHDGTGSVQLACELYEVVMSSRRCLLQLA
jgi:translation initiation factor 4A